MGQIFNRLLLSILFFGMLAVLWDPSVHANKEDAEPEETAQMIRDQGIHYYRMQLIEPAIETLVRALERKELADDYRTHYYLARAYYEALVVESAIPMANKAVGLAQTERQIAESSAFLRGLNEFFGGVKLLMAPEQEGRLESGYIHLEDREGIINVEKKEVFEQMKARLEATLIELPMVIYLPGGSYAANRAPFEIQEGAEDIPEVEIILYAEQQAVKGTSPWYFVGGGVATAAAVGTVLFFVLDKEPEMRKVGFGEVSFISSSPATE